MAARTRTVFAGYSREAPLYLYREGGGPFVCCFCVVRKGASLSTETGAEMADHLADHRTFGHHIPETVDQALRDA
jgi:hypothetical protein